MAEEQTIAINVLDHEASETIIIVRQRHCETNATRSELRRQRVRIRDLEISIPTAGWLTVVVWDRFDDDLSTVRNLTQRLEHDHRPITADNAEEFVVRCRASKRNFKPQHIAIERKRCRNIGDDKER